MLSTMMTAPPERGAGSGGRDGGVRAGRLTQARPIPRQKLVQTVLREVGDPGQDIGQPRRVRLRSKGWTWVVFSAALRALISSSVAVASSSSNSSSS